VISFVVRVRQIFLFDRYVMSPDVYGDRNCRNRQLGIFIKKNARFNRYVAMSSMRDLNASKASTPSKYFCVSNRICQTHATSLERFKTTD
jgi:hypothetical protein